MSCKTSDTSSAEQRELQARALPPCQCPTAGPGQELPQPLAACHPLGRLPPPVLTALGVCTQS